MYATLESNTVGQCHMSLKPRGRKVLDRVEKSLIWHIHQTADRRQRCKSAALCRNDSVQAATYTFLLAEGIALAQAL